MQSNAWLSELCQEFPCNRNIRSPLGGIWQPELEEEYSLGQLPSLLHRRELDTTSTLGTGSWIVSIPPAGELP